MRVKDVGKEKEDKGGMIERTKWGKKQEGSVQWLKKSYQENREV